MLFISTKHQFWQRSKFCNHVSCNLLFSSILWLKARLFISKLSQLHCFIAITKIEVKYRSPKHGTNNRIAIGFLQNFAKTQRRSCLFASPQSTRAKYPVKSLINLANKPINKTQKLKTLLAKYCVALCTIYVHTIPTNLYVRYLCTDISLYLSRK